MDTGRNRARVDPMPVVKDLADFDTGSGSRLERAIFNNRMALVVACALVTAVLAFQARKIVINASFERMIPQSQPLIRNYLENRRDLRGLGNSIRVVVESTRKDIFDPGYLDALKQINDELFLTQGVDRAWLKSLWTPVVRWKMLTEEGFVGGPVMPAGARSACRSCPACPSPSGRGLAYLVLRPYLSQGMLGVTFALVAGVMVYISSGRDGTVVPRGARSGAGNGDDSGEEPGGDRRGRDDPLQETGQERHLRRDGRTGGARGARGRRHRVP